MVSNLIIASAVAFGLFVLLTVVQSLRKNVRAGCGATFLLLIGVLTFVVAIVTQVVSQDASANNQDFLFAMIATSILIVGSLIGLILDRGKDSYQALFSRGVLGITTGVMLLAAYFVLPLFPTTILPIPSPTPIAAVVQNTAPSNIVPTDTVDAEAGDEMSGPTLQPTVTRTPIPSPSPTRTRRAYIPPTITPTPDAPTVADECGATVATNLNVRAEPNTEAEVVAIIPEGRYVDLTARTDDFEWWQTEFEGEQGWVAGNFLTFNDACLVEAN